jgi:hypothetical protein
MRMVEVVVTDRDGRVVERRAVNEDLFNEYTKREEATRDYSTRWFIRLLGALFAHTSGGASRTIAVVDEGGTTRTVHVHASTFRSDANLFNSTFSGAVFTAIAVGTGTAPPTRDDFRLASPLARVIATVHINEDAGIVTLTAGFTWTEDRTIAEIGLILQANIRESPYVITFLLDRTVLDPPITVPAGHTLTVVYRFRL